MPQIPVITPSVHGGDLRYSGAAIAPVANIHMADEMMDTKYRGEMAVSESVGRGFANLSESAKVGFKIYQDLQEKKKEAKDKVDEIDYMNNMKQEANAFNQWMSQNQDKYKEFGAEFEKRFSKFDENYQSINQMSPEARAKIQPRAMRYYSDLRIGVAMNASKIDNGINLAKLDNSISTNINDATLDSANQNWEIVKESYNAKLKYNYVPEEVQKTQLEQLKSKTYASAWEKQIKGSSIEETGFRYDEMLRDEDKEALETTLKAWKRDGEYAKVEETNFIDDSIINQAVQGEITNDFIKQIPKHRPDMIIKAKILQANLLEAKTAEAVKYDDALADQAYLLFNSKDGDSQATREKVANLKTEVKTVDGLRKINAELDKAKKTKEKMSPVQRKDRDALFGGLEINFGLKGDEEATLGVYDNVGTVRGFFGTPYMKGDISVTKNAQAVSNIQRAFDEWANKKPDWTMKEAQDKMKELSQPYAIKRYQQQVLEYSKTGIGKTEAITVIEERIVNGKKAQKLSDGTIQYAK